LLQGGVGEYGTLPQNLRIVSNFFRAGPDGTVRAFSQPIVHELNKNITTAGLYMGFPVTERPYSIVLGSSEEGVKVAEGLDGVKDTLSIGYLELTEDLLQRLPSFLSSYDAVVLGDGNFHYIKSLLEELLQVHM